MITRQITVNHLYASLSTQWVRASSRSSSLSAFACSTITVYFSSTVFHGRRAVLFAVCAS
jgi:hypothetical protein